MNFYAYQKLLGKINDSEDLRNEFIKIFDEKTKAELVRFGILLGEHLLEITSFEKCIKVQEIFKALENWLSGKSNYHEARNIDLSNYTSKEYLKPDKIFYQAFAQIACICHVRFHALWATDFIIKLINKMHPNDFGAIKIEREYQISILREINLAQGT